MNIRIIHPPGGEAPDWVRAAWVGLVLPVNGPEQVAEYRTKGVLTGAQDIFGSLWNILRGRTKMERGYRVRSAVAISLLSTHAPEAAAWWIRNTPHFLEDHQLFIFQETACAVDLSEPGLEEDEDDVD